MDNDFQMLINKNDVADRARGDAISRNIAKEIPLSEQVAILRKQVHALVEASMLVLPTDEFTRLMTVAQLAIQSYDQEVNNE